MKTLLASAILLTSTAAFAHDTSHGSCDVNLEVGVKIDSHEVAFSQNGESLYKILDNETLVVEGKAIPLSDYQQALVSQYSQDIRATVPAVRNIALEGMDLALEGINLAFNELLGEGNDVGADLTRELSYIRTEIDERFSVEHGVHFNEGGIEDDELFGAEFEERIEEAVESVVKQSMGTLLIAVGQEMLFAGGDMEAFEARMENFGESIESRMEHGGEQIEKHAEELCQTVVNIDAQEEMLKQEIEALEKFNVISVSHSRSNEI